MQIVTKFGIRFDQTSKVVDKPLIPEARSETIRASVEGSLRRLQTDHIDLHFQHRVDPKVEPESVAQTVAATIDEIYERTGQDSILVPHSQGGLPGWEVPRYTEHVAAIVATEPGAAPTVDSEAYNALLEQKIPVTFYYGDYIGEEFTDVSAAAMWSMMAATADTFAEAYNAADGSSTVVHLPGEGITGNSHFMFQELNNDVIADHIENWIQENVDQ